MAFSHFHGYAVNNPGLFMKKATKWAMGIIAFAILILVAIWGSMKMVQLEKEQEQAQKKLEEEQKVKEQK